MVWFISNDNNLKSNKNHLFITNIDKLFIKINDLSIYIDGYIIPRTYIYKYYKDKPIEYTIYSLYNDYGTDFIHHLKGSFILILFIKNKYYIYNDRHSLKKYFIYQNGKNVFISNSLKLISEKYNLNIDKENIAVFTLVSHFIDGCTLFKNVSYCRPAEVIEFDPLQLNRYYYWKPSNIFEQKKNYISNYIDYAQKWKQIISNYISYFEPEDITLTLTGGNDSRMVLSALLAINKNFHTFTYGNPNSYDGSIAREIRKNLNLVNKIYFESNISEEWFRKNALTIISYGNSLINIHRAHRNDAIIKEVYNNKNTDMIFTGLVGGEYLKEPKYDNITIPIIFNKINNSKNKIKVCKLLKNMLLEKGVRTKEIDIIIVYEKLMNILKHGNKFTKLKRKFIYTYLYYGCSHHTQDSNVFGNYVRYVINPFMDIDYLEMIADYDKWYINNKPLLFSKIFHSNLLVQITNDLAPELSKIPYAKRGKYTANDLLNRKYKYLIKRLLYFINKDRDKYPQNFPMGIWLYNFCSKELLEFSKDLLGIYDIDFLKMKLNQIKSSASEESWHIITNPININMNYEYFKCS